MDQDVKYSEVGVYDHGESTTKSDYNNLWDDNHFNNLLRAGPAQSFDTDIADAVKGNGVLVIGCGNGSDVERTLEHNAESVVGIELSATRLKKANDSINEKSVSFVRADAEMLPFQTNNFDIVLAHSVLHHLPNWRTTALSEICRVLREQGSLLFYEPGRHNPPAIIRRTLFPSNIHTPDEQPFNPSELERTLRHHFEEVNINGHCILSNTIPVIANYSPVPLPNNLAPIVYKYEQNLMEYGGTQFAWVITGCAMTPRSTGPETHH